MKKKTIMGILSVFIVIILIIGYLVIIDLNQEKKLKQELEEINDLVGDSNSSLEEIEKRLDKTVTKGDYKIVEKAFKNYLKDSFNNVILMIGYLSDERITSILTADNYRIDMYYFDTILVLGWRFTSAQINNYYFYLTDGSFVSPFTST